VRGDRLFREGGAKHVEHEEVRVDRRAKAETLEVRSRLYRAVDGVGLAEVAQVIDHADRVPYVLFVHPFARSEGDRGHAVQIELAHEGDQRLQDLSALFIAHVHDQLGLGKVLSVDEVPRNADDRGFVVRHLPDGNHIGLPELQCGENSLFSVHDRLLDKR
jgi:hypothetical protein